MYYSLEPFTNSQSTLSSSSYNVYNPETHELVEKKEAKIARLKQEIEDKVESLQVVDDIVRGGLVIISQLKDEIDELSKELTPLM